MTTDSHDDQGRSQPAALGCNEGLGLVGDSTVLDCWRANYGLDKTPHELHSFWQHCTPPGAVLALKAAVSEIERLREELRQKHAEYDDMKSLLLGNARNLNLKGEQARQTAEYWKAQHLAGNARIGELHDELAATALRSADHLRKAIKAEARAGEFATDAQRYRILRNCNMDVRNRLEHYGGDALDERLDALNSLALGPNVVLSGARTGLDGA